MGGSGARWERWFSFLSASLQRMTLCRPSARGSFSYALFWPQFLERWPAANNCELASKQLSGFVVCRYEGLSVVGRREHYSGSTCMRLWQPVAGSTVRAFFGTEAAAAHSIQRMPESITDEIRTAARGERASKVNKLPSGVRRIPMRGGGFISCLRRWSSGFLLLSCPAVVGRLPSGSTVCGSDNRL